MIIVEGPDGAGKTTLIEHLQVTLGLPVADRVVSDQARAMTDLRDWTDDNLSRGFQYILFDRHRLISDPIYELALPHREPNERLYEQPWLFNALYEFYKIEPIIIYCLPARSTVVFNIKNGPDDNSVVEPYILKIYDGYVARAGIDLIATPARVALYDYERPNALRDIVTVVKQQLGMK